MRTPGLRCARSASEGSTLTPKPDATSGCTATQRLPAWSSMRSRRQCRMPDTRGVDIDLAAVRRAAAIVAAELPATPLVSHPLLDRAVGRPVLVKHENVLPTGSFKVRGGVHLASTLTEAERRAGLVSVSTGNHAQSVAYAARLAGTTATIVMPTSAPQVKADAVEAIGGTVVRHGPTMVEATAHARDLAASGRRYVDTAEPAIVLGHATLYLELFEARPDLAAVVVPIGSGTGAAGACVVRDALAPECRVVGVQSHLAPAAHRSWRSGSIESAPCTTRVSGLATGYGYPLPQSLIAGRLDDFLLVDDDAIADAARLMASHAHTLAEGAGAAALAGLLVADLPDDGHPVAVVCTGGNASAEEVADLGRATLEACSTSISRAG